MIKIEKLTKCYGDLCVLDGIDLTVREGEVIAVIGPSGTGKSTLLRCINCLEEPSGGAVTIDDLTIRAGALKRHDVLALRRKTAMVFQNYNLFNNKTALQNIMEPMVVSQKTPKEQAGKRALDILDLVGLTEKQDSYPSQLSGGQQQRVGIGRAMATSPKVILFDEPTSSLDPELVQEVLDVIRRLAEQKVTMLITTHEMEFARSIADRVLFMADGRIIEQGTPEEIFEHAAQERTRLFLKQFYGR